MRDKNRSHNWNYDFLKRWLYGLFVRSTLFSCPLGSWFPLCTFETIRWFLMRPKWLKLASLAKKICTLRGGSRGVARTPSPPLIFKYPMKMKYFGLSETKLFHFHGIFKKNEIKSAKWTPHLYTYEPTFWKSWIRPWHSTLSVLWCILMIIIITIFQKVQWCFFQAM